MQKWQKAQKSDCDDGKLVDPDDIIPDTKAIVSDIMNAIPATDNPESALQHIFFILAVLPSVNLGLIDLRDLTVSGDGTAVISHTSPYGKDLSSWGAIHMGFPLKISVWILPTTTSLLTDFWNIGILTH